MFHLTAPSCMQNNGTQPFAIAKQALEPWAVQDYGVSYLSGAERRAKTEQQAINVRVAIGS